MRVLLAAIMLCFLLSACQKGQEGGKSKEMGMESGSKSMPMENQSSMSGEFKPNGQTVDGTFYVDQSKDVKEFRLRSHLAGLERMIDQYKKDGYDASELESEKAQVEQDLTNLG